MLLKLSLPVSLPTVVLPGAPALPSRKNAD
jgi:hypothetical protein